MSDTRLRRDALLILNAFRNVEILTSLEIGDGGTRALSGAFVEREPEHMHGILNINLKRYSRTAKHANPILLISCERRNMKLKETFDCDLTEHTRQM